MLDIGVGDFAFDQDGLPQRRMGNGIDTGFVLITQWQMQQQVVSGEQAKLVELGLGCLAGLDGRCCDHSVTSMASISTSAPRGSSFTPTAARAG